MSDAQPPNQDRMPGRPRRRYFNRVSATLAALVMCAIGFYAGVRVERSQISNSSSAADSGAAALAARFRAAASGTVGGGAGAPAARAPGGGASFGTVSSVRGGTVYVTESSGNTVKVKLSSSTKISKSVAVGKKSIHPGDTVVIQGLAGKNGTVTAASVSDSGTGSSGIRGLFGGGLGGSGGSGSSGGSGGSSAKSAVGSLFSSGGGG